MRTFYGKYFTLAAIIAMCVLMLSGAFPGLATTLADVEKSTTMKTNSPMDKAPDVITLQKGETVIRDEHIRIDLNGKWELTDKGTIGDNKKPGAAWDGAYTVTVPSSIASAMYEAGVIGDPMYGMNDADAKALGERTWFYRKTFTYNGTGKKVMLCFDGVADRCNIYLNGEKIGDHQGMFGGPYIDISDSIAQGQNTLVVMLQPVLHYSQTVVFNCS